MYVAISSTTGVLGKEGQYEWTDCKQACNYGSGQDSVIECAADTALFDPLHASLAVILGDKG